jgi:hypothetical protein
VIASTQSAFAGDGDLEGFADLQHPLVAEAAETLDQRRQRDALERIEIDDRCAWHGIVARLQQHLAWNAADRRRARSDQRASKARNRRVSREHDYRTSTDLRELTPPDFSPSRKRAHEEPAAARNDARSPHSSPASTGTRSYAA